MAEIAARPPAALRGAIIAGSTHPRDVDLSGTSLAVAKIVATEDGIAPMDVSESLRRLLPADVAWHRIEGGNHSQFGWYGTQLGDGTARITRARQQDQVVAAVLATAETRGGDALKRQRAPVTGRPSSIVPSESRRETDSRSESVSGRQPSSSYSSSSGGPRRVEGRSDSRVSKTGRPAT